MNLSTKENCIESLVKGLRRVAEWRRKIDKRFPGDPRNVRAAETCERLAHEAASLGDAEWTALQPHYGWASERWFNAVSEAGRCVEFRYRRQTFSTFLEDIVAILAAQDVAA